MANNQGFSNDGAWKAFLLSIKIVWWGIKAIFKAICMIFTGYQTYKAYKARKAAERAERAADRAVVDAATDDAAKELVDAVQEQKDNDAPKA